MEILEKCLRRAKGKYIFGKRNLCCPARTDVHETKRDAKPFDSIPGPKSLPLVGTLWKYIPLLGEYRFDHLHVNGLRKLKKYGTLVREDIVPGVSVVWVFTPEDIETVYRCEGRYPERRSHLALQKYRRDRPHIYNSGGLLPTNGEEWWRLRSVFQRCLSRVQDVRSHLPVTDEIMGEFTKYAATSPGTDFLPKLSRLYLELTCMTAFSTRLRSFSAAEQSAQSRSSQLIAAAATTNSCVLRTDNGPRLWRWWRTPLYRRLETALVTLESTAVELVNKVQKEREGEGGVEGTSLVAQYLASAELNIRDIYGMAVDLILAGIDTTTYTTCFALYHLATHPDVQREVYSEASQLLRAGNAVTVDTLTRAVVTRAVVKETLRLNPVSVGVGRILAKDAVLGGYHVPAGTVVVTQNQVTCRLDKYFPRPDDFMPQRWMKGSPEYQAVSPYLVLPFGHGPRACIARRLAEQAMQVLLLRIVRDFELSWEGGKLGVRSLLINKPDQPVLLRLNKRS